MPVHMPDHMGRSVVTMEFADVSHAYHKKTRRLQIHFFGISRYI